jgi:hypothetical protein
MKRSSTARPVRPRHRGTGRANRRSEGQLWGHRLRPGGATRSDRCPWSTGPGRPAPRRDTPQSLVTRGAEPSPSPSQKLVSPARTERSRFARRSRAMDLNSIHVKSNDRGCCSRGKHQRATTSGHRGRDHLARTGAARLHRRALDSLSALWMPLPGRPASPPRPLCHLDAPRRWPPGDQDPQCTRGTTATTAGGRRPPAPCAGRRAGVHDRRRSGQRRPGRPDCGGKPET